LQPKNYSYDSPHTKAMLLLQAHFERMALPISDYLTDLKSVLDQAIRILQAMVDVVANKGFLSATLEVMYTMQCVKQARWHDKSHLLWLPRMQEGVVDGVRFQGKQVESPMELIYLRRDQLEAIFKAVVPATAVRELVTVIDSLPKIQITLNVDSDTPPPAGGRLTIPQGSQFELVVDLKNQAPRPEVCSFHVQSLSVVDLFLGFPQGSTHIQRRAYTPHFPKPQTESWWLVFADKQRDELLAMKRVSFGDRTTTSLTVTAPIQSGEVTFTVHLISDCYMGLDFKAEISLSIV